MTPRVLLFTLVTFFALSSSGQVVINTIVETGVTSSNGGSICYDKKGNLYFLDVRKVKKVDPSGTISTVAGTGGLGWAGDGGAAIYAQTDAWSVAVDSIGNLYIADHDGDAIRKVDTFGIITTIAGTHGIGYSGDGGPAISAELNQPFSIALNSHGEVFFGEANHVIRKIDHSGIITTYTGNGTPGDGGDGGPATAASLDMPLFLAFDRDDNLFISDYTRNRIRKVDATTGIITTVAGTGTAGFGGDGGSATAALIKVPMGLVIDSEGVLYFGDAMNYRLRKVEGGGISTFAGNGTTGFSGDGGDPLHAQLSPNVGGLILDKNGNIVFLDHDHIRIIKPGGVLVEDKSVKSENVKVYPNPCDGHSVLRIETSDAQIAKITICDAVGSVVSEIDAATNKNINISLNNVPGIYLVRVTTSSGTIVCKLLVI